MNTIKILSASVGYFRSYPWSPSFICCDKLVELKPRTKTFGDQCFLSSDPWECILNNAISTVVCHWPLSWVGHESGLFTMSLVIRNNRWVCLRHVSRPSSILRIVSTEFFCTHLNLPSILVHIKKCPGLLLLNYLLRLSIIKLSFNQILCLNFIYFP